mgnify:CR=1 FL=1
MNNPELTAILDEVSAGRMSTGQRAHRMQQLIRDAEQAHRPFAAMVGMLAFHVLAVPIDRAWGRPHRPHLGSHP